MLEVLPFSVILAPDFTVIVSVRLFRSVRVKVLPLRADMTPVLSVTEILSEESRIDEAATADGDDACAFPATET
jgi:hypothetical protein